MLPNFTPLLLILSFAWLVGLTILFWRMLVHYNKLIQGGGKEGIRGLLEQVLKESRENKKDIENLRSYCDKIEKEGHFHIQKVGLLRFNPFKDTGGDQSFILSLVDKDDTGVIISGLYSRSGLRWYAKKVERGKGIEHELSDEEKRALRQAVNTKNS
ncbi:MAG: DUF4446 family protein [Candidatus Levybacteria bacterium]|nr:DUF4446 family protein [Candidatus Levybacteria bacterium]